MGRRFVALKSLLAGCILATAPSKKKQLLYMIGHKGSIVRGYIDAIISDIADSYVQRCQVQ
jgi:hypothetical protein